jgi:hypothetical protein
MCFHGSELVMRILIKASLRMLVLTSMMVIQRLSGLGTLVVGVSTALFVCIATFIV